MKEYFKYIVAIIVLFVMGYIIMITITDSVLENNRIKEMAKLEIEKKYLIKVEDIPYDLSNKKYYEITQTYINYSPEIRVRKIVYGNKTFYMMAIKRYVNDNSLTREETEMYITQEEYEQTVVRGLDNTILKNRYQFKDENGTEIAIDIFKGALEGLAYLEIEFENEQEANKYVMPSWVIEDITENRNYKNGYLARYGVPNKEEN